MEIQDLVQRIHDHSVTAAFALLTSILAASFTVYVEVDKRLDQRANKDNLTITRQIESLDNFETGLNELMVFVDSQREQLEERESIIQKLESDKKLLEPLVEADREVVEALLASQAELQKTDVWLERLIGFLLGIAGSLIASLIWKVLHK